MRLPRGIRLKATGKEATSLPLTPEDYFVLSRVDGTATVGEIADAVGLGEKVQDILGRLLELGAIERVRASGSGGSGSSKPSRVRTVSGRHRAMMAAALKGGAGRDEDAPRNKRARAETRPEVVPNVEEEVDDGRLAIEPVSAADPRLEPSTVIPIEEQRLLLAMEDNLAFLSHFDVLGIAPSNDKRAIRRAYYTMSRRYHPDSYYGRDLGRFRELLTDLFERAKVSYDVLMDDSLRVGYVERLLEQRRREADSRRASERARNPVVAAPEPTPEPAAAPEPEELAAEREARARERAKRDEARRKKMGRRMAMGAGREDEAKKRYDEGVAEQDQGRHGAAASLFRLAMKLDPSRPDYEKAWKESLGRARTYRARQAYERAERYEQVGQLADAARYYVEAAKADPLPLYLSEAAAAIAANDPDTAREMAMQALQRTDAKTATVVERARIHVCAAIAFKAAGQEHSAREQARSALELSPSDREVRRLLNNLKLT